MKIFSLTVASLLVFLLCLIAIGRPTPAANASRLQSETDAAQLFNKNCAKCHGKDGRAKGFKAKVVGARNLTDGQWQDRVERRTPFQFNQQWQREDARLWKETLGSRNQLAGELRSQS